MQSLVNTSIGAFLCTECQKTGFYYALTRRAPCRIPDMFFENILTATINFGIEVLNINRDLERDNFDESILIKYSLLLRLAVANNFS